MNVFLVLILSTLLDYEYVLLYTSNLYVLYKNIIYSLTKHVLLYMLKWGQSLVNNVLYSIKKPTIYHIAYLKIIKYL